VREGWSVASQGLRAAVESHNLKRVRIHD
jgi:hypothetical protein